MQGCNNASFGPHRCPRNSAGFSALLLPSPKAQRLQISLEEDIKEFWDDKLTLLMDTILLSIISTMGAYCHCAVVSAVRIVNFHQRLEVMSVMHVGI